MTPRDERLDEYRESAWQLAGGAVVLFLAFMAVGLVLWMLP